MSRILKSREELLDAMAYAFIYSADPSTLDAVEQRSFRDDVTSILRRVGEEIAQSSIEVQRNWFTRAKEKIEEGLVLFDGQRFEEASRLLGQAEDIFRSGISGHARRNDFVVAPDGIARKAPNQPPEPMPLKRHGSP